MDKITRGDLMVLVSTIVRDGALDHSEVVAKAILNAIEDYARIPIDALVRVANGEARVVEVVRVNDHQNEATIPWTPRRPVMVRPEGTVLQFPEKKS